MSAKRVIMAALYASPASGSSTPMRLAKAAPRSCACGGRSLAPPPGVALVTVGAGEVELPHALLEQPASALAPRGQARVVRRGDRLPARLQRDENLD